MAVMSMITVALPPAPDWPNQQAFATVFNFVPRLVVASLIAYWCGEFANSYVMAKMKILTQGRMLWTRTIGSTVVGQAVDTIVLMIIAFGGSVSWQLVVTLIVSGYLGKVLYEAAMTPVTYWVVGSLKRYEGVDTYDTDTEFSPFPHRAVVWGGFGRETHHHGRISTTRLDRIRFFFPPPIDLRDVIESNRARERQARCRVRRRYGRENGASESPKVRSPRFPTDQNREPRPPSHGEVRSALEAECACRGSASARAATPNTATATRIRLSLPHKAGFEKVVG